MASGLNLTTWLAWAQAAIVLDLESGGDTVKCAAFDGSPVPNLDTDTIYGAAPWNAGELAGGGYSAGGATVAGIAYTIESTRLVLRHTAMSTANVTGDLRYLVFWDDTVGDRVVFVADLGQEFPLLAEPLNVSSPDGLYRIRR